MKQTSIFASMTWLATAVAMLAAHANAEEPPYKCWAVIAARDGDSAKLADLTCVELSRVGGLRLVDRERIDQVCKEAALSALMGTRTADRVKLGRALAADALLVLSVERIGGDKSGKQCARVVISDCEYGARLRSLYLPYEPASLEALAKEAAAAVIDARRQFAAGIRHIVAITPLVSKNLSRDYDHLQSGYARLLETAIASVPGLATLEVEEARYIARELELGGKELKNRAVPVFVEGEFEMEPAEKGREPKARLEARIHDGRRISREFSHAHQTYAQVAVLLGESIPQEILRLVAGDAAGMLSRQSQQKLLAARADEFSRLGNWGHAIALRDAAILLAPDDIEQRLAILADYRAEIERRNPLYLRARYKFERGEIGKEWDEIRQQRIACWRGILPHVEHVIRGRVLNCREACLVLNGGFSGSGGGDTFRPAPCNQGLSAEEKRCQEDFADRMYALFPSLDSTIGRGTIRPMVQRIAKTENPNVAMSRDEQLCDWTTHALPHIVWEEADRAVRVIDGTAAEADDRPPFDRLYRFLTEAVPADCPPLPRMSAMVSGKFAFFPSMVIGTSLSGRLPASVIRQFYKRLLLSDRETCVLYGRCGLCTLDALVTPEGRVMAESETIPPAVFAEAEALLKLLKQRGHDKPAGSPAARFYESWVRFCERLPNHNNPIKPKLGPPKPWEPAIDTAPRVSFEPIAGLNATWNVWRQCGDSLDVLYSRDAVYVMEQKGVTRRVFTAGGGSKIQEVQWDGKHFWVRFVDGPLRIIAGDGTPVASVGVDEGLPSLAVRGMCMAGPGRAVVVGQIDERVWFAEIAIDKNSSPPAFRARVFHKAMSVPPHNAKTDDDPNEAFIPAQQFEYAAPDSGRRQWVVACWPRLGELGANIRPRRPRAVDLDSLAVTVFPCALPFCGGYVDPFTGDHKFVDLQIFRNWEEIAGGQYCSADGRVFMMLYNHLILAFSPAAPSAPWSARAFGFNNGDKRRSWDYGCPELLQYKGAVYRTGSFWFRIRPSDVKCELLTSTPLSQHFWFRHYAVSAHYGLVAWNDTSPHKNDSLEALKKPGAAYRVVIDRPGPPDLDVLYPGVPAEKRTKHHQAIQAVQALGGVVCESWLSDKLTAYVLQNWKGGDAGLSHLADIHGLASVQLSQTPVTDDGLRRLAQCESLTYLRVWKTAVTRAALAEFRRSNPKCSVYDENDKLQ